jgi:hypothetical protein
MPHRRVALVVVCVGFLLHSALLAILAAFGIQGSTTTESKTAICNAVLGVLDSLLMGVLFAQWLRLRRSSGSDRPPNSPVDKENGKTFDSQPSSTVSAPSTSTPGISFASSERDLKSVLHYAAPPPQGTPHSTNITAGGHNNSRSADVNANLTCISAVTGNLLDIAKAAHEEEEAVSYPYQPHPAAEAQGNPLSPTTHRMYQLQAMQGNANPNPTSAFETVIVATAGSNVKNSHSNDEANRRLSGGSSGARRTSHGEDRVLHSTGSRRTLKEPNPAAAALVRLRRACFALLQSKILYYAEFLERVPQFDGTVEEGPKQLG